LFVQGSPAGGIGFHRITIIASTLPENPINLAINPIKKLAFEAPLIFLSKFLPLFVYPAGLVFILILAAIVLHKKKGLRTFLLWCAFLILFVAGNRWVSMTLARSLEWKFLPLDPLPSAEVILVLGGSTEPSLYPRSAVEVNSAGDRVLYAADLFEQKKAPQILLSGGRIDWLGEQSSSPAEDMREILLRFGIPEKRIWLQTESRNTEEDARYCLEILKKNNVKRVLLVTSAMHMPRAVELFRGNGIEIIPAPTDYTVTEQGWYELFHPDLNSLLVNLMPNSGSLSLTTNVMKEYIGMAVYSFK
jgi:uncharacterized SAM-binding protein YcdF (DUF218 family)